MDRPVYAVLLAGRIRPSPLSEALDMPVLCLPIGRSGSLMDAWMGVFDGVANLRDVQVVVNARCEVDCLNATALHAPRRRVQPRIFRAVAEPAPWRGAAGLLRDVTEDVPEEAIVIVCEANRLPPPSLEPLIGRFLDSGRVEGAVGVCGSDRPSGLYVFDRRTFGLIPSIGYFDLKEQFMPALRRQGGALVTARLDESVCRMHDVDSYLDAVRRSFENGPVQGEHPLARISARACVSPSAVLDGACIIEAGAVVEDGAVVHDTVVLWGATVGGGAVVTQSVVGSLATVGPRQRICRAVVTRAVSRERNDQSHVPEYAIAREEGVES